MKLCVRVLLLVALSSRLVEMTEEDHDHQEDDEFVKIDADGNGLLSPQEMEDYIRREEETMKAEEGEDYEGMTDEEISDEVKEMFEEIDIKDKDGFISEEEWKADMDEHDEL